MRHAGKPFTLHDRPPYTGGSGAVGSCAKPAKFVVAEAKSDDSAEADIVDDWMDTSGRDNANSIPSSM
jgi:hypothetical protein